MLARFCQPNQVMRYASAHGDIWHYCYKERRVWGTLMDIAFNRRGVVPAMVSGSGVLAASVGFSPPFRHSSLVSEIRL